MTWRVRSVTGGLAGSALRSQKATRVPRACAGGRLVSGEPREHEQAG